MKIRFNLTIVIVTVLCAIGIVYFITRSVGSAPAAPTDVTLRYNVLILTDQGKPAYEFECERYWNINQTTFVLDNAVFTARRELHKRLTFRAVGAIIEAKDLPVTVKITPQGKSKEKTP